MKLISSFTLKIIDMYYKSYVSIHIFILFLTITTNYIYSFYVGDNKISFDYLTLLNGMGFLSSFFILAMDKIDFSKINQRYSKKSNLPFISKQISQGSKIVNSFFSITFSMFLLLLIQYILIFFGVYIVFFLLYLIIYIFLGFIMLIGTWQGLELLMK